MVHIFSSPISQDEAYDLFGAAKVKEKTDLWPPEYQDQAEKQSLDYACTVCIVSNSFLTGLPYPALPML